MRAMVGELAAGVSACLDWAGMELSGKRERDVEGCLKMELRN